MAYTRTKSTTKVKGDSLDAFVTNLAESYSVQVKIRNAEDETRFNQAVLEQNISLGEQLQYREDQLKRVVDDPEERKRIRLEIAGLKDRIEQKNFGDTYLQKLVDYEAGISSIDSVIGWLKDQRAGTEDQTIQTTIDQQLVEKEGVRFQLMKNLITDQTNYALNDKTESVLSKQLTRVNAARSEAILNGNKELEAMLDLHVQALTKAKSEAAIEKDIKNFSVSTMSGYSTAVKLLDGYNSKIKSAGNNSVTINGVTYDSEREYWTYKRDEYVSDQSASGLIPRMTNEATTKLKTSSSKSTLSTSAIKSNTKDFDKVAGRPELRGYEDQLAAGKQEVIQTGADLLAGTISKKYSVDYDLNKAVTAANALSALGANTDDIMSTLITAGSKVKEQQVSNILSTAQALRDADPNLDLATSLSQAIASGAGATLSPEELATQDEGQITKDLQTKYEANAFGIDPRLTAPGAPKPGQPAQPQQPTGADAPGSYKTITIKSGETLGSIALRELGSASKYMDIAKANNIADPNKIQAGATIRIPVATTTKASVLQQPSSGASAAAKQPKITAPVANKGVNPPKEPAPPKMPDYPTPTKTKNEPAAVKNGKTLYTFTTKTGDTIKLRTASSAKDARKEAEDIAKERYNSKLI